MTEERRSGEDRRVNPPVTCTVPCKPMDDKLNSIWNCLKGKVSQTLFLWLMGGMAFFTIVIMGGAQWAMVAKISDIGTDVKVMKVTVDATKDNLSNHMATTQRRYEAHERRIDDLEHKQFKYGVGK